MNTITPARTWAFLDLENLLYPWKRDDGSLADQLHHLVECVRFRAPRAAIIGVANRKLAGLLVESAAELRVRLHPCDKGPDAADLELIDRLAYDVPDSCERVIIGSGDHLFAMAARRLRAQGRHVTVLCYQMKISSVLYRVCDDSHILPAPRTAHHWPAA